MQVDCEYTVCGTTRYAALLSHWLLITCLSAIAVTRWVDGCQIVCRDRDWGPWESCVLNGACKWTLLSQAHSVHFVDLWQFQWSISLCRHNLKDQIKSVYQPPITFCAIESHILLSTEFSAVWYFSHILFIQCSSVCGCKADTEEKERQECLVASWQMTDNDTANVDRLDTTIPGTIVGGISGGFAVWNNTLPQAVSVFCED